MFLIISCKDHKDVVHIKRTPKITFSLILQKDFVGFKEALAHKESRGYYDIKNEYGYVGKYQFGKTTLRYFKIYNTQKFLKNPELQEKTFEALCKVNKWILRKEIEKYSGQEIKGITITESGILAAAHLVGAYQVKKFLKSNGKIKAKDGYGTTITSYLEYFAGYDTSYIQADSKAIVS